MILLKLYCILFVFSVLILAACSGTNKGAEAVSGQSVFEVAAQPTVIATAVAAPTEIVTETAVAAPTTTPNSPIDNLSDVRSATVRIAFEGSYLHYAEGEVTNFPNHGSGFIIDPSGIAVTNNHVVTGAAFLEVWLDGEKQPRNARVLGVSECSDLAVIDIDGDDFPYLDWYDAPLNVGMDVYAAGFPVYGNTEYTLTRGIITKEQADGEMPWASVEHVLEIDAKILGGNSGGPLVTADGQVVAVNFAGIEAYDQSFSIASDVAIPIIEHLRGGQDLNSIGVNGEAVAYGDGFSGIWVSSVASGSPADLAGLQPGDIITFMEGVALATDGTFADYCDVLRSHSADDTLTVLVYRYLTGETLSGQFNGDPLEVIAVDIAPINSEQRPNVSIHMALSEQVADVPYHEEFVEVSDDTGTLNSIVPPQMEFQETNLEFDELDRALITFVVAPDDPDTYTSADKDKAVFTLTLRPHDPSVEAYDFYGAALDAACSDLSEPHVYQNPTLNGFFSWARDCGTNDGFLVNVEVTDIDGIADIGMVARVANIADLAAVDVFLNRLKLNPLPTNSNHSSLNDGDKPITYGPYENFHVVAGPTGLL